MCLFPKKVPYNSPAYKHGMREFGCGVCPECLAQRARPWALRCAYEAKEHPSMMICLTYDSYIHDRHGRIVGERVASEIKLNKRDCQLFIKRLRKAFAPTKLKYLIAAEYGKKTHRPHYHALIFGIKFDDLIFYKKSKRGSILYKSATLDKIWGNGICTVDGVNINTACARYCTKYAMKDKGVDTFMLFSRDIGTAGLLRDFNGKSYFVEGKEYAVPKLIWRDFLCQKYDLPKPRYRSLDWCMRKYGGMTVYYGDNACNLGEDLYKRYALMRQRYQYFRDDDEEYQAYLCYWKDKAEKNPHNKLTSFERLIKLDDTKYHFYKQSALKAMHIRALGLPVQVPRSNSLTELFKFRDACSPFNRNPSDKYRNLLRYNPHAREKFDELTGHLPLAPCPLTANDTNFTKVKQFFDENGEITDFNLEFCKNSYEKLRKKIKHRLKCLTTPFD